ncbi:1-acyl-sn-glycerol-3-phosphate acyltransferase [compost metagenome]
MRTVFALYVWLVWALHMVLLGPVAVLATLISPHVGFWVVKAGSFTALGMAGIRVVVKGQPRVDWSRAHVLMGNHQGILDPFILVMALPKHAVGIEKRENFAIPIYGQLARAWGNLPIDRSNPEAARATITRAETRLHGGTSIAIFPEGTRSLSGAIGPFKKGGFHLAVNTGADIVPFSISGSYERLPPKEWRVSPGVVTLEWGDAVPTAGTDPEQMEGLMARVRQAIEARFLGLEAAK